MDLPYYRTKYGIVNVKMRRKHHKQLITRKESKGKQSIWNWDETLCKALSFAVCTLIFGGLTSAQIDCSESTRAYHRCMRFKLCQCFLSCRCLLPLAMCAIPLCSRHTTHLSYNICVHIIQTYWQCAVREFKLSDNLLALSIWCEVGVHTSRWK